MPKRTHQLPKGSNTQLNVQGWKPPAGSTVNFSYDVEETVVEDVDDIQVRIQISLERMLQNKKLSNQLTAAF